MGLSAIHDYNLEPHDGKTERPPIDKDRTRASAAAERRIAKLESRARRVRRQNRINAPNSCPGLPPLPCGILLKDVVEERDLELHRSAVGRVCLRFVGRVRVE